MARYGEDYEAPNRMNAQRDLVLAINEYCFVQNKTNGQIKSHVGPLTMTISAQEALVTFNTKTKKFEETSNFEVAKQLFVSAPEGWYIILKNPATDNQYPEAGRANAVPTSMKIGKKVNIPGPASFALFPGQMAKVIRGHKLRSNQYLLARVYDAEAANKSVATIVDAEGNTSTQAAENYFVGQLLVIKGTEVSFYIPPTGIEVIPVNNSTEYIRDAVTLERLEYAILKDEDGEKRYVHGPAVVFPKPTETFVTAPKGGTIFRALELSPISGIYVKVIADYIENDIKHPVGEELFITGNDQMIYYPRPEHAMIQYDGKYMHHAIAIPEGEGRYILDRLTGKIKTVVGPQMYLPDPRTEVVVKRKLTEKECNLFYPGNTEVLEYNAGLSEKAMEKVARRGGTNAVNDVINNAYSTSNQESTLAIFEAGSNISRGVSYTKPRTITLDTKYEGVVAINVWTGYAVNVISKTGNREILVGPATRLLNYDETLEGLELSTGRPKSTSHTLSTAYLRIENNRVSDSITAQTKDFVDVQIDVSYCVDFLTEHKDKWFTVNDYIKFLCDKERIRIKEIVKKWTIEEFYANSAEIVRTAALNGNENGLLFPENGMFVKDVEVLAVGVERNVAKVLESHQSRMISESLELSYAKKQADTREAIAAYEKAANNRDYLNKVHKLTLDQQFEMEQLANKAAREAEARAMKDAETKAKAEMQPILEAIHKAEMARNRAADDEKIKTEQMLTEIEKAKQQAYADTVKSIMASISPELVAALTSTANADMLETVTQAMSPYAMANGESVADVTNKLLRGTPLEGFIEKITSQG